MQVCRLTGQSLLRAERNFNKCNWSTARKKIGPVNRPCDQPIDVFSIASLMFWVTSRLADQRKKSHEVGHVTVGPPKPRSARNEKNRQVGYSATSFRAMSVPAESGRSISVTNRDIGPVSPTSMACKSFEASTEYPLDRSTAPMPCKLVGSSSKMLPNRQPQNGIGTGDGRRRGR